MNHQYIIQQHSNFAFGFDKYGNINSSWWRPLDVWTPLCKLKVRPLEMRMTVTELGSSPSVKPQGAVEKCMNARSLG